MTQNSGDKCYQAIKNTGVALYIAELDTFSLMLGKEIDQLINLKLKEIVMKKMIFGIIGAVLLSGFVQSIESSSCYSHIRNFCLESIDRGFGNNKKIMVVTAAGGGLYFLLKDKLPTKKRILRTIGVVLGVSAVCGVLDTARARVWPSASDIAAREQQKKDQEIFERYQKELKELPQWHKEQQEKIAQVNADIERVKLEQHKRAIRLQFNKMIFDHLQDPCYVYLRLWVLCINSIKLLSLTCEQRGFLL